MWEMSDFSTWQMWRNLKLPTSGICVMWRNFSFLHIYHYSLTKINNVYSLWTFVAFYATSFCKNHFFANYAVLSRNLFCRDIRVFVWKKIEPKIVYEEKKLQISGMCISVVRFLSCKHVRHQMNVHWIQISVSKPNCCMQNINIASIEVLNSNLKSSEDA